MARGGGAFALVLVLGGAAVAMTACAGSVTSPSAGADAAQSALVQQVHADYSGWTMTQVGAPVRTYGVTHQGAPFSRTNVYFALSSPDDTIRLAPQYAGDSAGNMRFFNPDVMFTGSNWKTPAARSLYATFVRIYPSQHLLGAYPSTVTTSDLWYVGYLGQEPTKVAGSIQVTATVTGDRSFRYDAASDTWTLVSSSASTGDQWDVIGPVKRTR